MWLCLYAWNCVDLNKILFYKLIIPRIIKILYFHNIFQYIQKSASHAAKASCFWGLCTCPSIFWPGALPWNPMGDSPQAPSAPNTCYSPKPRVMHKTMGCITKLAQSIGIQWWEDRGEDLPEKCQILILPDCNPWVGFKIWTVSSVQKEQQSMLYASTPANGHNVSSLLLDLDNSHVRPYYMLLWVPVYCLNMTRKLIRHCPARQRPVLHCLPLWTCPSFCATLSSPIISAIPFKPEDYIQKACIGLPLV